MPSKENLLSMITVFGVIISGGGSKYLFQLCRSLILNHAVPGSHGRPAGREYPQGRRRQRRALATAGFFYRRG